MKRGGPLPRRTPLRPGKPPKARSRRPAAPKRGPRPKPADREAYLAWQGQRERVYARAGGWCERCGCTLTGGFEAHHRKLRSRRGGDETPNLAALCSGCHGWVHAHPAEATAAGFMVPAAGDPAAGDPAARPMRLPDGRWVRLTDDDTYDVCFQDGEPA